MFSSQICLSNSKSPILCNLLAIYFLIATQHSLLGVNSKIPLRESQRWGLLFLQSKGWPSPKLPALPQPRLGWLHLGGEPRYAGEKDPHPSYQLFPNQSWVGIVQVVGQGFCSLSPPLFLSSSASNASISSQTKICVRIALSHARLIKSQKATIIIPFTRSCQLCQLSRALIIHYQSSMNKQYSGDSYFREQDFIQTNPHGTLTRILTSCPLLPQPARNLFRPSPSLTHCAMFS
jgi:hypothetical protein